MAAHVYYPWVALHCLLSISAIFGNISCFYSPLAIHINHWELINRRILVVHSEHVYHRQDSHMKRQPVLRSSAAGLQNWKKHSHGGSGVDSANVVLQNQTSVWYSTMAHLTVWDNSISDTAVVHPIVWYSCIYSHWLSCLLSCRSLSISFHTGYETTLQCCWLLVILDLVKLRKKINSFSYYEVYRCGLFYRKSQGIYCGEQRKEKKLTCLETPKHFAKQHSCVLQFNNFTEKNTCTSKKGHQIWNRNSISGALSRLGLHFYLLMVQTTIHC